MDERMGQVMLSVVYDVYDNGKTGARMTMKASGRAEKRGGAFTLVELLVVLGVIVILAGLLLPAVVKAKTKGQGIQCLNNHRQLILAWRMYNEDNADRLLYASPSVYFGDPSKDPFTWVLRSEEHMSELQSHSF